MSPTDQHHAVDASPPSQEPTESSVIAEAVRQIEQFHSLVNRCDQRIDQVSAVTDETKAKLEKLEANARDQALRLQKLEDTTYRLRKQMELRDVQARAKNLLIFNAPISTEEDPGPFVSDLLTSCDFDPQQVVFSRLLNKDSGKPIIFVEFLSEGIVSELLCLSDAVKEKHNIVIRRDIPPSVRAERRKFGRFYDLVKDKGFVPIPSGEELWVKSRMFVKSRDIPEDEESWDEFFARRAQELNISVENVQEAESSESSN
jgi:hypothetical protein